VTNTAVPLTAATTPNITANALHSQSVYNAMTMNTANAPAPSPVSSNPSTSTNSSPMRYQRPSPGRRTVEDEFDDDNDNDGGISETRNAVPAAAEDSMTVGGISDVSSLTYPTMTTASVPVPAPTVATGQTAAERYARYARKASQQVHQQLQQQQQPPQEGLQLQPVRRPSNSQAQL
jgi:hypothetical protein